MKKLFFLFVLAFARGFSQENPQALESFVKLEFFLDQISVGYEFPLAEKFLLSTSIGLGAENRIEKIYNYERSRSEYNYFWAGYIYSSPFLRGSLRYYFTRAERQKIGLSLRNNAGSFLGFQTKLNSNGFRGNVSPTLLNEFHFGQQHYLSKRFYLRYQIGFGFGANLGTFGSTAYLAGGIFLGYFISH